MTVLMVPRDQKSYLTLGPQVCEFIESYLVHGPGDLLGSPIELDDEKRALIYRMYEVYPRGHAQAGRRRFNRCALSLRKGSAKTELAALIAAVELHPDGPVRCDGFDAKGQPVGIGVTDPYIPLVAYTEEQSDELAYGALKAILERSEIAGDFDIGLTRVMRILGDGKAVSLATAPDARDGARTTFEVFDETHRLNLPRQRAAHKTMLLNLPKRKKADAWALEITTAYSPGEDSVAEATMDYARMVANGAIQDSKLFFFHRQAGDDGKELDLTTPEQIKAAVLEASGPVAAWSNIDGIIAQWQDPSLDKPLLERMWLNRIVRANERAFDMVQWDALADPDFLPPDKEWITLGFDGARWHDAVALVGAHILTGFMWPLGVWEKPEELDIEDWEAPVDEIQETVEETFRRWEVWRMYCDPPYWESLVAEWAGKYGEKRVVEWWTNRPKPMAYAIKSFNNAIMSGELLHDGDPRLARHVGNAVRRHLKTRDEEGLPMWTIYKERSDSPHKIDGAMAGILCWEARGDALTAGIGAAKPSVYEHRGLVVA